jgi:hypothetical protein
MTLVLKMYEVLTIIGLIFRIQNIRNFVMLHATATEGKSKNVMQALPGKRNV